MGIYLIYLKTDAYGRNSLVESSESMQMFGSKHFKSIQTEDELRSSLEDLCLDLVSRESTVRNVFCERFKSQPRSIIRAT